MKRIISLLLLAALVLGLCACSGSGSQTPKEETLQVGFARQNVMPPAGSPVELEGTAAGRIMTSFMDNLSVTCVAVKGANGETVLLYTMDRVSSNEVTMEPHRASISKATGIPEDYIMLAATHTHSAPEFNGWTGSDKYSADFAVAMVTVAEKALADLSPAEASYGSVDTEGLVFVRQYRLTDGTVTSSGVSKGSSLIQDHASVGDPQMQLIRFDRGADKKEVLLVCCNAHPTFFGGVKDTLLSADFPFTTREYIESQGNYQVAYFTGDAGDQAPSSKYLPDIAIEAKDYKEYGQRLGTYVLELLPKLTKAQGQDVTLVGQNYVAQQNKERLDMLDKATEVMSVYRDKGRDAANDLAEKYGLYQYLEASAIIQRVQAGDTRDVWMNVMAIGDHLSFAFAPYEMFSDNGKHIRADTPYGMTFLVSCCNGAEGYLPSKAACEFGCYEYYITKFAVGTAELLADEYLKMLTDMKNK